MEVNDRRIVAEVASLCEAYEHALVENDVGALNKFFWDSPQALRFGVTEELYGAEEIETFRRTRKVNFSNRKSGRATILSIGRDMAVATLEFTVTVAGQLKYGRRTQVWNRFRDAGWRIVSAHVSHRVVPGARVTEPAAAYAATAELYAGQPIDPAFREGVAINLKVAASIAAPLLAVEIAEEIDAAPRFVA